MPKKTKQESNKSLIGLLILAIAISIAGTWLVMQQGVITGAFQRNTVENPEGKLKLSPTGVLSIVLADSLTDFGDITFTGPGICSATTQGSSGNCTVQHSNDAMIIENDGDINAAVKIKAASALELGAKSAQYYKAVDNKPGSCISSLQDSYVPLTSEQGTNVCQNLSFSKSSNSIKVHFNLSISNDAKGETSTAVTFTASPVE